MGGGYPITPLICSCLVDVPLIWDYLRVLIMTSSSTSSGKGSDDWFQRRECTVRITGFNVKVTEPETRI